MKYTNMVHGSFEKKLNRFMAEVYVNGIKEQVHIKNTGRLTNLLQPGVEVLLEFNDRPNRKTRFSLISVAKGGGWVNIDSLAPNRMAFEALKAGKLSEFGAVNHIQREVTYGDSRFDLYFEKDDEKGFIEIKGVTLEENGVAMFPDAPTSRGTKHVLELIRAAQEGDTCAILFIVQMKGCCSLTPHREMDPTFADALRQASLQGVQILAYDALVEEDACIIDAPLPVQIEGMEARKINRP
ncbi:DNA/RNA nuclease SfsA [Paenibacillus lutimineralis]|uniref:Sugar fermentation stimulation protein homolog n=1 Tax=Paenibacillus lutimineralis TaxID=2707005 RepID=A0A3Q9IFH9_9BACL|nr:DNA/RNA nuclease SfsA [Paenibacillus lutimineralis]AZS17876.1 DNA/RNA nuclease SfsA [Paenibacillus lutimineralis]